MVIPVMLPSGSEKVDLGMSKAKFWPTVVRWSAMALVTTGGWLPGLAGGTCALSTVILN